MISSRPPSIVYFQPIFSYNQNETICKNKLSGEFEIALSIWSLETRALPSRRVSCSVLITIDFVNSFPLTEYVFQIPSDLCVVNDEIQIFGVLVVIELLHK